ncbi:hypothetical protein V2A60_007147 [Cordyceps javanica]|uniref:Uncharacterized protein n=1 Tax=Cordyceps javanica TaxID=43265 RepID=A0A545USK1_9HYPO|nr:hypothetical protein IF1G_08975 [Cordyceps javanica]TQW04304.1 hypothetical protein IF2G_08074 [Cordyceps javanica]
MEHFDPTKFGPDECHAVTWRCYSRSRRMKTPAWLVIMVQTPQVRFLIHADASDFEAGSAQFGKLFQHLATCPGALDEESKFNVPDRLIHTLWPHITAAMQNAGEDLRNQWRLSGHGMITLKEFWVRKWIVFRLKSGVESGQQLNAVLWRPSDSCCFHVLNFSHHAQDFGIPCFRWSKVRVNTADSESIVSGNARHVWYDQSKFTFKNLEGLHVEDVASVINKYRKINELLDKRAALSGEEEERTQKRLPLEFCAVGDDDDGERLRDEIQLPWLFGLVQDSDGRAMGLLLSHVDGAVTLRDALRLAKAAAWTERVRRKILKDSYFLHEHSIDLGHITLDSVLVYKDNVCIHDLAPSCRRLGTHDERREHDKRSLTILCNDRHWDSFAARMPRELGSCIEEDPASLAHVIT